MRILVVDDEADFRDTLAKRFAFRHIPVTAVASGAEALAVLDAEAFDAVLLDLRLPGMDGLATLEAIKASHPQVAVIVLTGHASPEAGQRGLALGAAAYMLKPVVIGELLAKLRQVVSQAQPAPEKNRTV